MKKRTLKMVGVLSAVMLVLIFGCDIDPMASVRKAAEQGDADAQHKLAWCYENGTGVARSRTEAKKWLRLAEQNGYKLSDGEREFVDEN